MRRVGAVRSGRSRWDQRHHRARRLPEDVAHVPRSIEGSGEGEPDDRIIEWWPDDVEPDVEGAVGRTDDRGLTSRESEIMELVASGLTNAAIAERLWISPGTVKKHLDNVFAKLGVSNRTAASARVGLLSAQP